MAPPIFMAGGLRALLQEESEHQWLAIGVFFSFILIGGYAIEGTQYFVGDALVPESEHAQHRGAFVMDVEYHEENESYTSLIYSPNQGYILYTEYIEDDVSSVYFSPETNDIGREVNFLKAMPDGEIMLSVEPNHLMGLSGNAFITYELQSTHGTFDILDMAEQKVAGNTHQLLLTQEEEATSLRGLSPTLLPTPAIPMTTGIAWSSIEALAPGQWVAVGAHLGVAGADGSSPASPNHHPAIGWISWDGSESTPVLDHVRMIDEEGLFHSLLKVDDGVIVAGTQSSHHIDQNGERQNLEIPSKNAVVDSEGTVWFIGDAGTTTITTWDGETSRVYPLSHPVPISTTAIGVHDDIIHVHGTDSQGNPALWDIDTQAKSSIESGRGFLNLLFLMAGTVVMGMMIWNGINKMRTA